MRAWVLTGLMVVGLSVAAEAIPNAVGGFIAQHDSPLNDRDLTEVFFADALWAGATDLPGEWRGEAPVGDVESAYLLARPRVFGVPTLLVQATRRDDTLDRLIFTFVDAGSYFGYFRPDLPDGISKRERQARIHQAMAGKQAEFEKLYSGTLATLSEALRGRADRRPRQNDLGKTRTLRTKVTDFRHGGFLVRLVAGENRLVRVMVSREEDPPRTWLDTERASLSGSDLARHYATQLVVDPHGDAGIDIPVVPQGYKPYCGLNTLAMAARYFGLHLDEDQLAVAGRFRNTGTADGSQMPRLYLAVAREAGLDMSKANTFDPSTARSCLKHGLPVIVWRRFSQERDRAHTRQTRLFRDQPAGAKPDPGDPAAWPGDDAPLHASILVGYNDGRREFLFRESWSGLQVPRRMHANEMTATAYLTFYFKP